MVRGYQDRLSTPAGPTLWRARRAAPEWKVEALQAVGEYSF